MKLQQESKSFQLKMKRLFLALFIIQLVSISNIAAQALLKPFVSVHSAFMQNIKSSANKQFQSSSLGAEFGIELHKFTRFFVGYNREYVNDFGTPRIIKNTNDFYLGMQGTYDFHKTFYVFGGGSIGLQYLEDNLCYDNYCTKTGPHPLYGLRLGAGWYNDLFFTQIFGTYSHTGKDMSFSGGPYFFGLGLSVGVYLTK